MKFGLIIGNRGFFPDHLAKSGRQEMIRVLRNAGHKVVAPSLKDTKFGAVETREEAKVCAALFDANRHSIDGIIVSLPNFGDERGVAETLRMSGLDVPVLIQATPDSSGNMTISQRRDSFCGKMSVCNNLAQYDIPYSITRRHTVAPDSDSFRADLDWFAGVCRIVNGLRETRVGAIGARPAAFNTVRYSEKLLEDSGIAVETVDLSEILGRIGRLKDNDRAVKRKLKAIQGYIETKDVPEASLLKIAKLAAVVEGWMKEADVNVSAIQCWTAIEEYYGIVPCTLMSMMSNDLMPSACEVDVCGTVAMRALALASETPSALLDWNNNYGDDPDKAVCFHCSNLPKHFFQESRMDYQEIIAGSMGKLNTFGTVVGRVKSGPMTFCRVSTDDRFGVISSYVGEGQFTDDPLETFGGAGVVEIPNMQELLHFICENGFEHHVAANFSNVAGMIEEAFGKYLGWKVHRHN
ncbi:MAG: fucose isomerase [bacterium]|nr:fucose isomerase [bacterium]